MPGDTNQIQQQFGQHAEAYATSAVHARGASLDRLLALVKPQPGWQVLDVATGAGHTAHRFDPHVARVTAVDLTHQMLLTAARLGREKGFTNVDLAGAEAGYLPFPAATFDLVTCRIAAHHFPNPSRFIAESARVLSPGGLLGLVDNIVPGSHRRGKEADRLRRAGTYVNAFERLRDPSHGQCLSLDEWLEQLYQAGFTILHRETLAKEIGLDEWAARMAVPPGDRVRLEVMLRQAPAEVAQFLRPVFDAGPITFLLTEAILVARNQG